MNIFYMKLKTMKKNINGQMLKDYFGYNFPSFLVKDLYKSHQNKNDTTAKYINESLIDLSNSIKNEEN